MDNFCSVWILTLIGLCKACSYIDHGFNQKGTTSTMLYTKSGSLDFCKTECSSDPDCKGFGRKSDTCYFSTLSVPVYTSTCSSCSYFSKGFCTLQKTTVLGAEKEEKTTDQTSTIPTSQPTTDQTSQPITEQTSQPTTEQTSYPTTEQTTELATDQTSQVTTEQTSQPTTEQTSQPTAEQTSQLTIEQTSQLATDHPLDLTIGQYSINWTGQFQCTCTCTETNITVEEKIKERKIDLYMDKKETSSAKNAHVCVTDNRKSAVILGTVGAIILGVLVMVILLPDIFSVMHYMHNRIYVMNHIK